MCAVDGVRRRYPDDDAAPDADDRVESDILATTRITEGAHGNNADEEEEPMRLIRHYMHSPNSDLNIRLSLILLTAIAFAGGLALGHLLGSCSHQYFLIPHWTYT